MASSDKGRALLKFICSMLFVGLFTVASKSTMLNSYFFLQSFTYFGSTSTASAVYAHILASSVLPTILFAV